MENSPVACPLAIPDETLSALRDDLLPGDELDTISHHVMTCGACQAQLARFAEVADLLRGQRELEPDGRILAGVHSRATRRAQPRPARHSRWWRTVRVLAPVAAVLLLFIYVLHMGLGLPGRGSASKSATVPVTQPSRTATAIASPTATPVVGTMRVSDPAVAAELSFAFVRDNDLWVSWQGSAPRQVTHFGLGNQSLDWRLVWSADHTKLLAVAASSPITAATVRGWILAMPGGAATALPLPAGANVSLGCMNACAWMADRYIVYHNEAANSSPHATYLKLYDTQTQRDLSTALDTIEMTGYQPIGTDIYFVDYRMSESPMPGPTVISRFDLASNTITIAFTVPVSLVMGGLPAGGFDLSADASKIVAWGTLNASTDCPSAPCHAFYQDRSGTATPILHSLSSSYAPVSISSNGAYAAALVGDISGATSQIVQQPLPSGHELTNALAATGATIFGWTHGHIIITAESQDASVTGSTTRVYAAPVGSSQAAHLVETVQGSVWFAPMGG